MTVVAFWWASSAAAILQIFNLILFMEIYEKDSPAGSEISMTDPCLSVLSFVFKDLSNVIYAGLQ